MIAINSHSLNPREISALQDLQEDVDSRSSYAEQVTRAKESWKGRPSAVFTDLKSYLAKMCNGNIRCVYCEDSLADEIEHMRPKDLFPRQTYQWENYVLACGPCNGPKNNKFAIILPNDSFLDITRKRNAPVLSPVQGSYALIDPRIENPIEFLWLDFATWRYVANSDDNTSVTSLRANFTIDVLGLNKREALIRGRKTAFSGFLSRVNFWQANSHKMSDGEKDSFIADFRQERYRGVWERMKIYRNLPALVEIDLMLTAVPEALTW